MVTKILNKKIQVPARKNHPFALRKGGSAAMKGGGVRESPIPTEPLHPMESGQSDIGDVVERGHGRVAEQDGQIVPPRGLHCLPFKKKVRVVSLRLTGGKVVIEAIMHIALERTT